MVRVQPLSNREGRFLVGSDLENPLDGRLEVQEWITSHRCRVPADARRLSVYERGALVREWSVVEAAPPPDPKPAARMFPSFARPATAARRAPSFLTLARGGANRDAA